MDKPKQILSEDINLIIKNDLKSVQGNECLLQISFKENKFNISIEKKEKIFKEKYMNEFTLSQIQENQYFKMFSTPKEILEELLDRIESKNPILNEINNNIINLSIFLPVNKFKQIDFNLNKIDNLKNENYADLKSIIEKLYEKIEKLEFENKKILEENKEIKEKNKNIEKRLEDLESKLNNQINLKMNNFHWINNEVNIESSSNFVKDFGPEVMVSKSNKEPYSCSDGNRQTDYRLYQPD